MTQNFSDKVVLVTGSGSGIGEAIAINFSRFGANVVITGRYEDNVKRVAKDCQSVSPKNLKPLEIMADLTVDDDCRRLMKEIVDHFGRIDILVNNAGIGGITDINDVNVMEQYDRIMRTNLRAVVLLTHLTVPYLEISKGNVVNISSVLAVKPFVNKFVNCISKTAVDMFTKCLAIELGPKGIRVNSVNPGVINTKQRTEEKRGERRVAFAKSSPLGVMGEPQDIAHAVAFLASADASFITGTCMLCDGGFVCGSPAR